MLRRVLVLAILSIAWYAADAAADPADTTAAVRVAVAANFAPVLRRLAPAFERGSGARLIISPGSTGGLYAQIVAGAPFDVFLAADVRRPQSLEAQGLTVAGSRFTYAVGRLVLWMRGPATAHGLRGLSDARVRRVAIANPAVAPYGQAARQALQHAGVWQAVKPKLIYGENIGQTFHYVATGGADAGLVAMSQLLTYTGSKLGTSYWPVPARDYTPLRQQAVLLRRAKGNAGAVDFLLFLRSAGTRAAIRRYGYGP